MARPKKSRKVCTPPQMKGYRPFGIPMCDIETVRLTFEEYESLKIVEYDRLSQDEGAKQMHISRPTFTRIYNKALKTIAKAFVEGKAIEIDGGDYFFEQDWYRCKRCNKLIEGLENHVKCEGCTFYGSNELVKLNG